MNCPNCNAVITCGCQKRTASDGKQICSSCQGAYENKLSGDKRNPQPTPPPPPPRYNR